MSASIDPAGFREAQHSHWDSAAVGWMEWSEFNDRAARHISERLVELAGVESGSRVLDIAAGYGEPALTAARKAGPEGHVVATDISAEMLAFGRERATAAGSGNIEFIQSDASGLEFPRRASTPPSHDGESSSSLMRRRPRGAFEASSSRARRWRSARGASPIKSRFCRFR